MSAPGARVLVVEDDPEVLRALRACLEQAGYEVDEAADGREALERARAPHPPEVMVVDLMLPVMDGWALLAELDADPALRRVPVVVVSAGGELALGSVSAAAEVAKPIDPDELVAAVDRVAGR